MSSLSYKYKENVEPAAHFGSPEAFNVLKSYEDRSVRSFDMKESSPTKAITMEELDQLRQKNLDKIAEIEERYFRK